jgi:GDP-4-dehydro-6-deoxy-D-mannose reductase
MTGGAGALGKALIARIRANKNCQLQVSDFRSGDGVDLILDVSNHLELGMAIQTFRPDLVIHLAASFSGDYDEAYGINVEATRGLFEVALQADPRPRIVIIGSAAEYGKVDPADNPISESRPLRPVSIYGLSKAWQTQLGYLYHVKGLDVVTCRIFNLDGPGMSERLFIGRIQQQIAAVLAGRESRIRIGALDAVRDYIEVDTAAHQVFAIATAGQSGEVYHVASGQAVSMRELLHRYLERYGLAISLVEENQDFSTRTGYDVPVIYADMSKTNRLLERENL